MFGNTTSSSKHSIYHVRHRNRIIGNNINNSSKNEEKLVATTKTTKTRRKKTKKGQQNRKWRLLSWKQRICYIILISLIVFWLSIIIVMLIQPIDDSFHGTYEKIDISSSSSSSSYNNLFLRLRQRRQRQRRLYTYATKGTMLMYYDSENNVVIRGNVTTGEIVISNTTNANNNANMTRRISSSSIMIHKDDNNLLRVLQQYYYNPNEINEYNYYDNDEDKECIYKHDWQHNISYPICNMIHEIDIKKQASNNNFVIINCGGDRCAYYINDNNNDNNNNKNNIKRLVLKTRRYRKLFDRFDMYLNKRDSMVMERLTSSPFVLSTYGYCGRTQIVETNNNNNNNNNNKQYGNLHDFIKVARLKKFYKMNSTEATTTSTNKVSHQNRVSDISNLNIVNNDKYNEYIPNNIDVYMGISSIDTLKIAIHISTSVADLHSFEDDGIPSVTHSDMCCHQFIFCNGIYMLNDFHLSVYLKRKQIKSNIYTNKTITTKYYDNNSKEEEMICLSESDFGEWTTIMHSPEDGKSVNIGVEDLSKSDVWQVRVMVISLVNTLSRPFTVQLTYNAFVCSINYIRQMANTIFFLLTKLWMLEVGKTSNKKNIELLKEGTIPVFPKYIEETNDNALKAIQHAILMAWTYDPIKRPTARTVSNYLINQLYKILHNTATPYVDMTNKEIDQLRKTKQFINTIKVYNMPSLPPNHRYTDSDYTSNMMD